MDNQQSLKIGDILIGDFKILDIFGGEGKSGMGVVYLVEQREYPFPIVLKTFQKNDEISTKRFLEEARTWVSIGIHPNIVQAYFVRDINEQLFIGAEYIAPDEYRRNTITNYLKKGSISNYNIIKWTAQFCYAMNFAISKGLKAHRDIKPDNLMIDQFGNLKVTDFGLAKAFNDFKIQNSNSLKIPNPNLTSGGSFLGTLLYASPEQILDSSSVDFSSDIYSFGIVLYQLISSGGFPYSLAGKTSEEQIAIMHLQESLIKINHPLFPIVAKCLAKLPEERHQSYKELLNELHEVAGKLDIRLPLNHIQTDSQLKELYIQSLSFLEFGDKNKALELINEYISRDKLDSSSWQLKGRIHAEKDEIKEAINATLRSYEIDPYNSRTLNNLGIFYGRIGEQDKGINFLMEAIRIDGSNAGAVMNLAIALDKSGAHSAAADAILASLDLTPDKNNTRINAAIIAQSAFENRLYDKAIKILERLTKLDNDNIELLGKLATVYQAANQKEKAIKCNEIILNKIPNDKDSLLCLASLNAELGEYDNALKYCEILLSEGIALLKATSFKAQIMQAQGRGREAINFVKKVLNNGNQNNDSLWMLLSTLFENEGHYEIALKCILQAKSILISQEQINQENLSHLNKKIYQLNQLIEENNTF